MIARADSAARPSVCTRTLLKSCPKRGSMNARVAASSGWPGERKTSSTIGAMASPPLAPAKDFVCTCAAVGCSETPARTADCIAGCGMRITWSATRSASCSNASPGAPTISFG
jgi:hypothetical protein